MRPHLLPIITLIAIAPLADEARARADLVTTTRATSADGVDDYVRLEMEQQHIPGLSLAVIRNGKLAKSAAYGLANVELNVPAAERTEFAIASMTKSVTASAVMLLVQDGKLKLDDPISKYIDSIPDSWRPITIRHLLTHTSGIKDHYSDFPTFSRVKLDRRLEYSDADYLKAHFVEPLNFEPGKYGAYSGSNFALLGMIITKVTGKSYGDFFRERIFVPLEMHDTHLLTDREIIPNRASGYDVGDKGAVSPLYTGISFTGKADVSVVTTADDLAKWIIGLTDSHLWTKESLAHMWTPGTLNDGREAAWALGNAYGAGWIIGKHNGFPTVGHGGTFNIGFTSAMVIFPVQRIAVVVLDNDWSANPARIAFGVAGYYDPFLKAPHLKSPDATSHPELVSMAQRLLPVLFGAKSDIAPLLTPGFARTLSDIPPAPAPPPSAPAPTVSFIALEDIGSRHLIQHGSTVSRMAFLKVMDDGDHYLTLYLTRDGKVADVSAY